MAEEFEIKNRVAGSGLVNFDLEDLLPKGIRKGIDLKDFLSQYDAGELLSYKGIAEGSENSNFLLHATTGAYISITTAALGGEIAVPTPRGGSVTLKIPAGTSHGRTFRVRGKGIRRKDGTNGDLLATVEVTVPQNLSSEARDALRTYAEQTTDHDPRKDLFALAEGASTTRGTS